MSNVQCSTINAQRGKPSIITYPSPAGSAPYCAWANASFCCNERVAQYSAFRLLLYEQVKKNNLMQTVMQMWLERKTTYKRIQATCKACLLCAGREKAAEHLPFP
jgi:hypothetical protein